jgi:hypothetical protein
LERVKLKLEETRSEWEPLEAIWNAKVGKRMKTGPFDEATRTRIEEVASGSGKSALLPMPRLSTLCFADFVNQFADKHKSYRAESNMA